MKYLKMLGLAAVAAMAFAAFAASSASATTLERAGAPQKEPVFITASLEGGTLAVLQDTNGNLSNKCTNSHVEGTTAKIETSGATVTAPVKSLSFSGCDPEGVTVVTAGSLSVENIGGTNGTVRSIGAEVKVPTTAGITANCKTGTGVHIGTLTGATNKTTNLSQHATMDIHAVLNCGFLLPSATWDGEYIVTTPTELGVIA
jgi:hypothetical protein